MAAVVLEANIISFNRGFLDIRIRYVIFERAFEKAISSNVCVIYNIIELIDMEEIASWSNIVNDSSVSKIWRKLPVYKVVNNYSQNVAPDSSELNKNIRFQ